MNRLIPCAIRCNLDEPSQGDSERRRSRNDVLNCGRSRCNGLERCSPSVGIGIARDPACSPAADVVAELKEWSVKSFEALGVWSDDLTEMAGAGLLDFRAAMTDVFVKGVGARWDPVRDRL